MFTSLCPLHAGLNCNDVNLVSPRLLSFYLAGQCAAFDYVEEELCSMQCKLHNQTWNECVTQQTFIWNSNWTSKSKDFPSPSSNWLSRVEKNWWEFWTFLVKTKGQKLLTNYFCVAHSYLTTPAANWMLYLYHKSKMINSILFSGFQKMHVNTSLYQKKKVWILLRQVRGTWRLV